MKDIDAFLPGILPFAPGCATPTAYFGIRQAAIEFCERTRLWRSEDSFQVEVDDCDAILAPFGAVVHEIERVLFNGQPLEPKTTQWLDQNQNGWRTNLLTGTPHYVSQVAPDTLTIVPKMAGNLSLYLWLKPSQDATELPDFIEQQYRETIAMGALHRILLIPNQSFTNIEMAGAYGQLFQKRLDGLSVKGSIGQQRAPLRTKAHMF